MARTHHQNSSSMISYKAAPQSNKGWLHCKVKRNVANYKGMLPENWSSLQSERGDIQWMYMYISNIIRDQHLQLLNNKYSVQITLGVHLTTNGSQS